MKQNWYGVRCLLRWENGVYEESVTIWRAATFDEAVTKAEAAANEYAETCGGEYLDLAQAYLIGDEPLSEGAEVFSLMRDSALAPNDYLDTFFATGDERQGDLS